MPIAVRIGIVVLGFVLIGVAELVDNMNERKPYATGSRASETIFNDAKVFTLRIFGAVTIFFGLISFVIANHVGPSH